MKNEPEIIKELRIEEKLGKLSKISQISYQDLDIYDNKSKKIPIENIGSIKDEVKNYDFNLKSTQQRNLLSNKTTDIKDILFQKVRS